MTAADYARMWYGSKEGSLVEIHYSTSPLTFVILVGRITCHAYRSESCEEMGPCIFDGDGLYPVDFDRIEFMEIEKTPGS